MNRQSEITILYSGGTDSTCAAAIMVKEFKIIHLLTFKRFGFFYIENANRNVDLLKKKFPSTIFIHKIIDVDHLARHISYNNFIQDVFKYGFFALSNCVICCLVNYIGGLIYCLDNKISNIADGSTRDWSFFPSHMEKVISIFKEVYGKFNINYYTPVYNFDISPRVRLIDKVYALKTVSTERDNYNSFNNTTGEYLFKIGIFSSPNVKGTDLDRKMQPRCLQFILHHIYLHWYFMVRNNYADFELITLKFISKKLSNLIKLVEENPQTLRDIIINNNIS